MTFLFLYKDGKVVLYKINIQRANTWKRVDAKFQSYGIYTKLAEPQYLRENWV